MEKVQNPSNPKLRDCLRTTTAGTWYQENASQLFRQTDIMEHHHCRNQSGLGQGDSNSHSGGWSPNRVHLACQPLKWPIVPAPGDYDDGEFGGMKIGRGNRSTWRKPAPVPLCPPQIPLDQTRVWTRAAAVGSQRLIAWATARPRVILNENTIFWDRHCVAQKGVLTVRVCNVHIGWLK
jgi:hypothetical protein